MSSIDDHRREPWPRRRLFLCFALAACVVISGCKASDVVELSVASYRNYVANWSPQGDRLVFYSDRDGDWELYVIDADGEHLEQLTHNDEFDANPSWSPDGAGILFDARRGERRDIYLLGVDGRAIEQITDTPEDDEQPAWSPDGKRIAWYTKIGETYELRVRTIASGLEQTILDRIEENGRLSWSADGARLALTMTRDGESGAYLVNADRSELRAVALPFEFAGNPSLSPDGETLAFDAHAKGSAESGDGKWEIWTVSLATGTIKQLTQNAVDDWAPRWSPDGTRLAYLGGGRDNTGYEVHVMNADGTNDARITFGAAGD
jgi:TolB protein